MPSRLQLIHRMSTMSFKAALRPRNPPKLALLQQPVLTENEDQLFTLLDEFCKHRASTSNSSIECRVAGGWVRDKLIGIQSDDIDIALSSVTGIDFAQEFVPYLRERGIDAKNPHTIKQNPDQSKHLETATADMLGSKIDFVNLRSEEYSADSRIPSVVAIGTPLEDALRRDINFNAMFYNIHTREVEDPLGKGLVDLRSGLVRTPLDPIVTFHDDPLRILRCVRFASRLGMKMNPDILTAAKDPTIQLALAQKVAKERVGIEVHKMLTGNDPMYSILLLSEASLIERILTPPGQLPYSSPSCFESSIKASLTFNKILQTSNDGPLPRVHDTLLQHVQEDRDLQGRLFLACLLTPWKDLHYHRKSHSETAAGYIIDNALKLGRQNHYLDGIPRLFEGLTKVKAFFKETQDDRSLRVRLGLILRDTAVHDPRVGLDWKVSLMFSLVQDLTGLWAKEADDVPVSVGSRMIMEYNQLVERINKLDLPSALGMESLMTGNQIRSLLQMRSAGPWIKDMKERIIEWQLEHPRGTKEQLASWILDSVAKGVIVMPAEPLRPIEGGRERKRARVEEPTEKRS